MAEGNFCHIEVLMTKSIRNAYMIGKFNSKKFYDWWWHSFCAVNRKTGELEPFFIEYYVINPGLGGDNPIFGQLPGNKKPSYAMIKAGKWGENRAQIHNFWGINSFKASKKEMNVQIDSNVATENVLKGRVSVLREVPENHPEYMTDWGEMSWDLKVEKRLNFSVGYGASKIFRSMNLFSMFWHVQGMKAEYSGTIVYNNQPYDVIPQSSYGYQDKNWGKDYTNPWIWLNCNNFRDKDGKSLTNSSLDIGGGNPKIGPISLGEKILVCFYLEGRKFEFNFTHLLFQKQNWKCYEDENNIYWDVDVSNLKHRLKVNFSCKKDGMILVNYENPEGLKNHKKLWNGGYAQGTLELYEKKSNILLCSLTGENGGCEYGRY